MPENLDIPIPDYRIPRLTRHISFRKNIPTYRSASRHQKMNVENVGH